MALVQRALAGRSPFYQGNTRQSLFDVQVSENGTTWTQVLTNKLSSGTSTALESFTFSKHPGRYVRIVGHGNTDNLWNSYTEVEIHGMEVQRDFSAVWHGRTGCT